MLSKAINPADARLKPLKLQEIHHHNLGQSVPQPTHDLETKLLLSPKQIYHAPPPQHTFISSPHYPPSLIYYYPTSLPTINYLSSLGPIISLNPFGWQLFR